MANKKKEDTSFDYAQKKDNFQGNKGMKGAPTDGGVNMVSSKDKQSFKDIISTLGKVFKYVGRHKKVLYAGFILAAASSILLMLGPNLIGQMADAIQNSLDKEIDILTVSTLGFTLIVIYGLSNAFSFIQQYIMAGMTAKVCMRLRSDFIQKLNKLPLSYFNTHLQGDILSCITNDIQTLRQGISRCLPGLIKALAQFFTCLIMMIITEWHLTLCVYGVVLLGLIAIMTIMKMSQKFFDQRQSNLGALNGLIEEMYSGYQVIKMSLAKKKVTEQFDEGNEKLYKTDYMSQFISGIMAPMMVIIGNVAILVVIVVGANLAISNVITFGAVAAFLLFCNYCTQPLTRITQYLTDLQGVCAAAVRLFAFLEAEEMPNELLKEAEIKEPKGEVEFDHVKFSYPSNPEKIIINDFSAKVKPGQKVAIVGQTGAGKTTLVNLLMRFYDVNSGEIKIDGIPINDLRRDNIHDMFGMVLQETWLFEGTVRENLVYNLEKVPEERIIEVCKTCGVYDFIVTMPEGFDTKMSESLAISAGQKQLITIARAMLQNAPMLILDEATSSVDTRTELDIQLAMDMLTRGRTSFVIAHRLSTIQNANLILVMEDGDVVESGTHDELIKLGGKYFELYNSQFQES